MELRIQKLLKGIRQAVQPAIGLLAVTRHLVHSASELFQHAQVSVSDLPQTLHYSPQRHYSLSQLGDLMIGAIHSLLGPLLRFNQRANIVLHRGSPLLVKADELFKGHKAFLARHFTIDAGPPSSAIICLSFSISIHYRRGLHHVFGCARCLLSLA